MEKVFGFRPPPDKVFNDLIAVRKIALKLRTSEAVEYLNFDYFKRRNIKLNAKWVIKRKDLLMRLLTSFEKRLEKRTLILQERLRKELDRLHSKRLKQYDTLMTKYQRVKNLLSQVNSKEKHLFQKSRKFFDMKDDVPRLKLKRQFSPTRQMLRQETLYRSCSDMVVDPNDIKPGETIRDNATGQTLMSVALSVVSKTEALLKRRNTIAKNAMIDIKEESLFGFSVDSKVL